jgi:hypothetical protein
VNRQRTLAVEFARVKRMRSQIVTAWEKSVNAVDDFPCGCFWLRLKDQAGEPMHKKPIADLIDSSFDEEAAFDAALERAASSPLREVLKREHDEILRGRPRDVALEKWRDEIEEMILRDLAAFKE